MICLFGQADEKGLNANDYDGPKWAARLSGLKGAAAVNAVGFNAAASAVHFDLALTVTAMRYVSDIHFGRFVPGVLHTSSGPDSEIGDLPSFIRRLANASDVIALTEAIEPPFPGYRWAETALQHYLTLARDNPDDVLPVAQKAVALGGSYAAVDRLPRKLRLLGDLPPGESPPAGSATYDGVIVMAVRSFQCRHGLLPDGHLNAATFAQLNTPLRVRIRQLQLTLEGWRWAPHQFPRPPIVVNIREFELRAMNGSYTTDLEMKVVVGKAYGHQTPIFAGELQTVIFRPYWDVPRSIERAELLPKLARDCSYLARNGYEVVTAQGQVVASYTVTPAMADEIRSGVLRIRQRPGPMNALGLIKYIFPNVYNVYLTARPKRSFFRRRGAISAMAASASKTRGSSRVGCSAASRNGRPNESIAR